MSTRMRLLIKNYGFNLFIPRLSRRSLAALITLIIFLLFCYLIHRFINPPTSVTTAANRYKYLRVHSWSFTLLPNGTDPTVEPKRAVIKQMMLRSWNAYRKYAWGYNELAPISRNGYSSSIFGGEKLGATIVDAMDTLWIMGLRAQFDEGRAWIERSLSFAHINSYVSVFEVTIRYIGGLLSCFALTHDVIFVRKATQIADQLLPAFDSPTGLPYSWVIPRTGAAANFKWASSWWPWPYQHILAEAGSLHLEFSYLSALTGNAVYREKVEHIRDVIQKADSPVAGLYSNYIHSTTGQFSDFHVSLGPFGDSFYEYLLKSWLMSNQSDHTSRQMYIQAAEAIDRYLIKKSRSGLVYLADMREDSIEHRMTHLACFAAGMFALGATTQAHGPKRSAHFLQLGADLAHTCHESYVRTLTRIGPEAFWFDSQLDAQSDQPEQRYYILRPEVIESWFYLWRLTKDVKYRAWAWDAVQALEKYCLAPDSLGYSGLVDVDSAVVSGQDNVQQSFWLAETLKYLYLIFSNDELIPLDQWVFNTEAHPLPILYKNRAYPNSSN